MSGGPVSSDGIGVLATAITGVLALAGGVFVSARRDGIVPASGPASGPGMEETQQIPIGALIDLTEKERLRAQLRARDFDHRGYIKVNPADYPGLSYAEAAAIAGELRLLAEARGNLGFWNFGPKVVEAIAPAPPSGP